MLKTVVYRFDEVPERYWEFAEKYGTIFQSKPYVDCLNTSGRLLRVVVVSDDDEIIGGLAVRKGRQIRGFALHTAAYFGPVVKDKEKAPVVLKCAADAIKTMSLSFAVTVRPEHFDVMEMASELAGWQKQEIEFLHWDISGSPESILKAMRSSKREGVRRGRKEGAVVRQMETAEDVEEFYRLYSMSMRKGGLGPGSLDFLKGLITKLGPSDLAAGFLALHPETKKAIAGLILLMGLRDEASFFVVGHDYKYRKFRAPDLLWWHSVEYLKSKGVTIVDFMGLPKGDAPKERGLREYKLALAGKNSLRYPSCILTRGNFGLNPHLTDNILALPKKVARLFSK